MTVVGLTPELVREAIALMAVQQANEAGAAYEMHPDVSVVGMSDAPRLAVTIVDGAGYRIELPERWESRGCPVHDGRVHGSEASELRSSIEELIQFSDGVSSWPLALQQLLDRTDARDSLAHEELELRSAPVQERRPSPEAMLRVLCGTVERAMGMQALGMRIDTVELGMVVRGAHLALGDDVDSAPSREGRLVPPETTPSPRKALGAPATAFATVGLWPPPEENEGLSLRETRRAEMARARAERLAKETPEEKRQRLQQEAADEFEARVLAGQGDR